ncbi:MAG: ABC transporter permease [Candidatus Omnitrophica bacterium]|nr:ABC transporter permease [Candidatus Omnitrophota bacterium]
MRSIIAICSKDVRSYFSSFVGYIIIAIFLVISGYFFFSLVSLFSLMSFQAMQQQQFQGNLNLTEIICTPLLMNICVIMLFMIPMLTMRSFAEEKKGGTTELLFTYPISDFAIVMGKYCAVLTVFAIMMSPLLLYPVLIKVIGGAIVFKTYLTGLFGIMLMGMSFLALGIFVSSLTENQIIAVTTSFGALLLFWIIGWSSDFAPKGLSAYLTEISIIEHFKNFAQGLIDTQDILFYGLFITFFLFFTLRVIESRNWRG